MTTSRLPFARPVAAFGSWWLGELAGMLPAGLRRVFRGRRDQLVLELEETDLVLKRWEGDALAEIGRVPLAGPSDSQQRAMIREVLARVGAKAKHVALLLPRRSGLRKLLSLPLAAEENLHQVLTFEMDRQTPFRAEHVYFDHRIVTRRRETGRMDVELVLLPRPTVDDAVERVGRLGLSPEIVGMAGGDRQDPNSFNLLPKAHGGSGRKRSRRVVFALGLVAVGLLAAIIYVPLERQRDVVAALSADADTAREEAEVARRLRTQIDQAIEQGRLIVLKKMEQPSVVHVLDEITRLLNDDTWLIRMRMYENEVQIFGYSNAASLLIGAIEDSPLFRDAQFRAPVTRDPRVDAERFHMSFHIAHPPPQVAGAETADEGRPSR